jgi:hypothetical protein
MSFDWKSLIGTVAPTIVSAFGTPFAGMATKVILDAVGITPKADATEEEKQQLIEDKLQNATPADILAIKNADYQFKKDMKTLDVELNKLELQDRESARQMQIQTKSWAAPTLAGLAIIIVVVLAYYVMTTASINEYAKGVVLLILGRFLGYIDDVYSFEFGTTRTSRVKDETIQKLSSSSGKG